MVTPVLASPRAAHYAGVEPVPFQYTIQVAPGPEHPELAQLWASRLASDETISIIKQRLPEDWRQVLDAAAQGYSEFMGTDDPKRALAALKQKAALAVTDADAARQRLIEALDTYFKDRVNAAQYKYAMRTRYIIPVTSKTSDFVRAFIDWAREKIDPAAYYFGGAVAAATVYTLFIGVLLADAARAGSISAEQAQSIASNAAGDLKKVLDLVVDGKGVSATVSVSIDATNATLTVSVEIPDPSQ